jgi:cbb3-type cytochrome oxidase cytochrome c subunit
MKFVEKNAVIKFTLPEHPHLAKEEFKRQKDKLDMKENKEVKQDFTKEDIEKLKKTQKFKTVNPHKDKGEL